MTTLLVLGSKPDPVLPPADLYDAVACANASGWSAQRAGLPAPIFTVVSSVLASGKNPSNRLALSALSGLTTDTVYIYPRPPYSGRFAKQLRHPLALLRTTRLFMPRILKDTEYTYKTIKFPSQRDFTELLRGLCGNHPVLSARLQHKAPSSGVVALALGLVDGRYDRFIISGFSFEITHAYADNPDVARRGSRISLHAPIDIAVLSHLARQYGGITTSEPVVHERTEMPLIGAEHLGCACASRVAAEPATWLGGTSSTILPPVRWLAAK
jgi:hypothetical protein